MPGQVLNLEKKGQTSLLNLTKTPNGHDEIKATLYWNTEVDLDLHCFYVPKSATLIPGTPKKFLRAATPARFSEEGHIYYCDKGSKTHPPFIHLDGDAGVGGRVDSHYGNEENMQITKLDDIQYAMIVTNIFNQRTNFAQFGGKVTVQVGDQKIEVPLTETKTGSWCVVALIDNTGAAPRLININEVLDELPTVGLVSELY